MARLTKIQIKNYRSIRDSGEITITKLFALIGKNNTGKSSFLKAIQILMQEITDIEISDFHKGNTSMEITGTIERWNKNVISTVNLKIACDKAEKPKPKYFLDGEEKTPATYAKIVPPLLVIPDRRDPGEFSTAGQKISLLKKILLEKKTVDVARLASLTKELDQLKREEAHVASELLTAKFRSITQGQSFNVKIEPTIDISKSTTHRSTLVDNDIVDAPIVGVTESGTGVQSLYLLTLLDTYGDISGKSDDAILIIEDPEVYLHPTYQRSMFEAMRKIASDNQVIFSTHSPIMISRIWIDDDKPSVRQVRLESGETKVEPVDVETVISELGIRYEDVLNPKLIIFVEGENDEKFYKKLGIVDSQIAYIPTDSFQAMDYFAYMKIISSLNVSNTFVVIADSDGRLPREREEELKKVAKNKFSDPAGRLASRLDAEGTIYISKEYAIESYFINFEVLHCAFPNINGEKLKQFVDHYKVIYAKELANVHDHGNQRTLQDFQKFAKPKLIFDCSERKHQLTPQFEQAYTEFWQNDENFNNVRKEILIACGEMEDGWFGHILGCVNFSTYPELITIKNSIMKLIE